MATELGTHGPGDLFLEGPSDPDAQATVTDFIDYTEYLPSDLVRSLTLIRDLDKKYLNATNAVHELTKVYGQLPDLPPETRPDPNTLRIQISEQLKRALNAREASFAESSRLYDVVDRHFNRLGSIKSKLAALKITTAQELHIDLPATTKEVVAKKEKSEPPTKITLRLDAGARPKARTQRGARGDRTTVLDPNQAAQSVEGSEGEVAPAPEVTEAPKKASKSKKGKKNGVVSQEADVAGKTEGVVDRSTSRALAALSAPPLDAVIGSEHRPWLRLTEWEMANLRKKMKKNSLWQPSEVMINRELAELGRGWDNYRTAKANAEAAGTQLIDCDDVTNTYVPGKLTRKSDVPADTGISGVEEIKLSNRGMKMNEAKKLKRESQAREHATQAAAEAELAAKRLGDIGSTFKNLFSSLDEPEPVDSVLTGPVESPSIANGTAAKPRAKPKSTTSKKRKLDEAAVPNGASEDVEAPESEPSSAKTNVKRLRLTKPAPNPNDTSTAEPTPTTKISLSLGPLSAVKETPAASSVEPERPVTRSGRRPSTSKGQPTSTTPTNPRTTRHRSATAGPTNDATSRDAIRRKSTTPGKATGMDASAILPTTARRSRRPAPGPVTAGQDGGSAVSVGRRKAKPAKKQQQHQQQRKEHNAKDANSNATQAREREDIRIDEDGVAEEIDPNEPRYCICGDVSFGTMICCEANDCDKEWFHLECVGLTEVPSRTAKWYCPDCRKKLGKAAADGIIRAGGRR